MIKKILFATDLGVFTTHSLVHVEHLAVNFKARVHVVHAVPPIGEFAAAVVRSRCSDSVKEEVLNVPGHVKGLLETLREQIFEILATETLTEMGLLGLVDDICVQPGQPAEIILSEAERIQADLVVVGSHGMDSLDGRMLGSVATKVLQLSRRPVMMIPMLNPVRTLATGSLSHFRL